MINPCASIFAFPVKKVSRTEIINILGICHDSRVVGYGFYQVQYKENGKVFTYEVI